MTFTAMKIDFNIDRVLKVSLKGFWYLIRIATAVLIVWWCFGQMKTWREFQVFKEWDTHYGFTGEGTYESPYLIQNADDLIAFSDAVNNGNYFANLYFRQTADIDLAECDNFVPIGTFDSNYMFRGVYDGGGHRIYNIHIDARDMDYKFVGLFGKLGGVVMNLGIESGTMHGEYVGAIAAADSSNEAMIINCYNRADLYAIVRCGGIADNFSSGRILGCANYGHLSGEFTNQIVSYGCALIGGCCIYEDSHDDLVPINSFDGRIFDCYLGSDDESELSRYISSYGDLIETDRISVDDVIPWEPLEQS